MLVEAQGLVAILYFTDRVDAVLVEIVALSLQCDPRRRTRLCSGRHGQASIVEHFLRRFRHRRLHLVIRLEFPRILGIKRARGPPQKDTFWLRLSGAPQVDALI